MGLKDLVKLEGPLLILLLGVLLSHLGTLMVMPMLPIMLKMNAGLTLGQIGIIFAAIAIAFQLGSIIGGILADRIGRRFIIGLGAFITGVGLIGFAVFSGFFLFLVAAVTMGLGTGLNAPSTKAAIAAIASNENRTTAFSMRGIAANIGTATAGLVVYFLITGSAKSPFWIAAVIYFVLATKSWLLLPKNCGDSPCPEIPKGAYREPLKNKPFLVFSSVTVLIWALYAQLSLALPIVATVILPDPKNVALIWTINSVIVISTQGMVTKKVIDRLHPLSALSIGVIFITIGISSLYFSSSFFHLAISGAIFVIGEMIILPTVDSTISQLSTTELIGLFFALANVVFGLGEATGKSLGGSLLGIGEKITAPDTPYTIHGTGLFSPIPSR
ncbi:MAG TPA: MFS transporter, partial [Bacillus bacterium]|nr:MFS transporter [Bacillus sp. (in: firmicutes)]